MQKLIDAGVLIEQIAKLEREALQQTNKYDSLKDPVWWNRWNAILGERTAFKYDLIDAPTVDAVEVVRCKDCKYFHYNKIYDIQGFPIMGNSVCDKWANGCRTDENGYCFLGERKENK